MIIDVPDGTDPLTHVWAAWCRASARPRPRSRPRSTSTRRSGCASSRPRACAWRSSTAACSASTGALVRRDGRRVEDGFDHEVEQWRRSTALDERARLAAEYAERYAVDHHGLDDAFWTRMREHYSDREIAELTMCLGSWIAFGRLNHVLGLDAVCSVPEHLSRR